ncbi:hypothetical protein [Maribellus sediminis]|uniref:hypothetical protein n=1 Tax=Maribellus sediminis TaxID=2696285 RepID=UPI00142F71FB|nr:hypothetical protein [Maribellus sediminis]
MKKQFLILILFVAAIVAGTSKSYGQTDTVQLGQYITSTMEIIPLTCVDSSEPLHPIAGETYTYKLIDTGLQAVDQWTWWATKDTSFIDAWGLNMTDSLGISGTELLYHSSNYGSANSADSVVIQWSAAILSATEYQADATGWQTASSTNPTPTFVVGFGTGEFCSNNIQVYEIDPKPNFTIDIANIDASGVTLAWDVNDSSCVSPVYSATYNTSANALEMNYGWDTLYFEISAANFNTNFMTYFSLMSGLEDNQTAEMDLYRSLADAEAGTDSIWGWSWDNTDVLGDSILVPDTFYAGDPADITDGVSVFLRAIIANNQYESLAYNPFTIAVDARDGNNQGIWDMEDDDCGTSALDEFDQIDQATHVITPRPRIDHGTQDRGAPDPTTIIPKGGGAVFHNPDYPEW